MPYLDFAKTFYSVNHRRLCDKMQVYDIYRTMIDLIPSFLSNRTFKVTRRRVPVSLGSSMQRFQSEFGPLFYPVFDVQLALSCSSIVGRLHTSLSVDLPFFPLNLEDGTRLSCFISSIHVKTSFF